MKIQLPWLLSPNLGCPLILKKEELGIIGFDVVIAEMQDSSESQLSLVARPSYPGEGKVFSLKLKDREELTERTLPFQLNRIEDTRFLISTTLHSAIFAGAARFFRYRALLASPLEEGMLRKIGLQERNTLYDLILMDGSRESGTTFHALCLRPKDDGLRFIHLTDLHVALRNDLYDQNLRENITYPDFQDPAKTLFNNFNENLRLFIIHANELADGGLLDFVLILGDLVDFLRHGFNEREDYGYNNFRVFRHLILGMGQEKDRRQPNMGLKVPIFTSTGNHDWRFFPYDPEVSRRVFGVNREVAGQLDLFWADEQEEISRKGDTFYSQLLREGAPVARRTWWGRVVNQGLKRLEKWQVKLLTPLSASAVASFLNKIQCVGEWLQKGFGPLGPLLPSALALVIIPLLMESVTGFIKKKIRKRIFDLISIEAGWQALTDYFLNINPYFNYAFHLGRNYFLILDTGHDCLRAQYLWDDGDKKMGPLSIHDNTIGQSPDSMAFYDINEYYPYSQIGWVERVMELIREETRKEEQPSRIFIGVHAPPANLSRDEFRKAQKEAGDKREGILLREGEYNIRYGTINHYLSHFYHLCLGRIEQKPDEGHHPIVDMVLAGHAHWKLEFRLAWDERKEGPLVYCGHFTANPDHFQEDFDQYRPFLFQTPACGPMEDFSPDPPYFRVIEIDPRGKVIRAEVQMLKGNGKAVAAALPPF
jgi:hypothetical protein